MLSSGETDVYQKVFKEYFVFGLYKKLKTVVMSSLSLIVLTVYTDIYICRSFTFEIMYLKLKYRL